MKRISYLIEGLEEVGFKSLLLWTQVYIPTSMYIVPHKCLKLQFSLASLGTSTHMHIPTHINSLKIIYLRNILILNIQFELIQAIPFENKLRLCSIYDLHDNSLPHKSVSF